MRAEVEQIPRLNVRGAFLRHIIRIRQPFVDGPAARHQRLELIFKEKWRQVDPVFQVRL
jgi:hypothetical protein